MLFLVLSSPLPVRPSTVRAQRQQFWRWIAPALDSGRCRWTYARPGRGAAVLFDVASHEELHALLTEWSELIPAAFEVHPLIDAAAAQGYLAGKAPAGIRNRNAGTTAPRKRTQPKA